MHELQSQLELLFDAKIQHLSVQNNPSSQMTSWQFGMLYSHSGIPACTVLMQLMFRNILTDPTPREPAKLLHMFKGVTRAAHIQSVRSQMSITSPFPVYTVEFTVYNMEEFTREITEYCWNNFNNEFTQQLDSVLEEE